MAPTPSEQIAALDAALRVEDDPDLRRLRALAVEEAWRKGDLAYKLDSVQRGAVARLDGLIGAPGEPLTGAARSSDAPMTEEEALQRIRSIKNLSAFLLWPRGGGKSYMLITKCLMVCMGAPNRRVLYAGPIAKDVEKLVWDTLNLYILPDCPPDLRKKVFEEGWRAGDAELQFPNGSTLRFRGCNNEGVERLRGPGSHFIVLDEAGSIDTFRYAMTVVSPVAERWSGRIWIATTPAKSPDHESKGVFDEHEDKDVAIKYTLLDIKRLSWDEKAQQLLKWKENPEDIPAILAGKMLPRTTDALRESWCEWVTDSDSAIIPEWRNVAENCVVRLRAA